MSNTNMNKAKAEKNDEFYTRLTDIEDELKNYKDMFRGKTVLCNCDDPKWSNFWIHLHKKFTTYGLKELISTHYEPNGSSYCLTYNHNGYTCADDWDTETGFERPLKGNGDFRSEECIELLKKADIVITNPPFSLFREYVAQLKEYKKDFIIIGNFNAVVCKKIFPLIRNDEIRIGYNFVKEFVQPDGTAKKFGNICWYTTLSVRTHKEPFPFIRRYADNPTKYPKYDNYDAVNVDKVCDIPEDYDGVMGVPITFLTRFNPNEFDIVSFRKGEDGKDLVFTSKEERKNPTVLSHPCTTCVGGILQGAEGKINGKKTYARVLIRRKKGEHIK